MNLKAIDYTYKAIDYTYIHTFIVMLQPRQAGLKQYANVIKQNIG